MSTAAGAIGISAGRIAATVFAPFAYAFFLSYMFRTMSAVIAPNMVADLRLDAADLGLISAAYFLPFAAFQLPLGLLLDRFGPRKVQAVLLCAAALGASLFAIGDSVATLALSRGLIGFGVSGCLMSALKAFAIWFPRDRLPLVNGVYMAFGSMGGMAATWPTEVAVGAVGWRGVFLLMAGGLVVAAAAIAAAVPERSLPNAPARLGEALTGLGRIYRERRFWRIAPICALSTGSHQAILGLWAGPWLKDVAGLDRAHVAEHLLVAAVCLSLGFLFTGFLTDRTTRAGISVERVIALSSLVFMTVQSQILCGRAEWALPLWALYGFMGNMGSLGFAAFSQYYPPEAIGRANTALNVLLFGMSFALQYLIGVVIGLWPAGPGGFDPAGYQAALGLVLAAQLACFFWLVWPRKEARI